MEDYYRNLVSGFSCPKCRGELIPFLDTEAPGACCLRCQIKYPVSSRCIDFVNVEALKPAFAVTGSDVIKTERYRKYEQAPHCLFKYSGEDNRYCECGPLHKAGYCFWHFPDNFKQMTPELMQFLQTLLDQSTRRPFEGLFLRNTEFQRFCLAGVKLRKSDFVGSSFSGCDLRGSDLAETNFSQADLSHADIRDANLDACDFGGASLDGVELVNARASRAIFNGARLRAAQMSGIEAPSASFEFAELSNAIIRSGTLSDANFRGAILVNADVRQSSFQRACLRGTDLRFVQLSECDFQHADLSQTKLFGVAPWRVNLLDACVDFVDFSRDGDGSENLPEIHGMYFHEARLRRMDDVFNAYRKSSVLVLGKDTGSGLVRLKAIQSVLREMGYEGILLKEQKDIPEQTLEEKVVAYGSLVRFVLCENSAASGHIDELRICATNRFVTVVLQEAGEGATYMQADYGVDHRFVRVFHYSPNAISNAVSQGVAWAEKSVEEKRHQLDTIYPWRLSE